MPNFYTEYNHECCYFSNPGKRVKKEYKMTILKDGKKELIECGETDIQNFINSFHDDTELHHVIEKYQMLQDPTLLNVHPGWYGDVSDFPNTLADMYRLTQNATDFFNSLPVDIRKEFNFSDTQFYASVGTDAYNDIMNKYLNTDNIDNEVKEELNNE
ncbi:minor capsid protein [Capybara microvirus Cap1_SP_147]|nr:minor capsid protein [Capybara microvirus Cap1_SP_147]